jgi:ribosomal protein S18 acetylase RimI-like enzyme
MPALRRMTESEWEAWFAGQHARYVAQLVDHGGRSREDAEAKATRDERELLDGGFHTRGQHFLLLEDGGEIVGHVWLGERDDDPGLVWVFDVEVAPEHRRRGYGRAAMQLAEDVTLHLGHDRLGLNVFAGNAGAIALYESLGYEATKTYEGGRNMLKRLRRRG